ncbi:MAG TPA: glycosyltransferase [Clostridia bacterium]|nr:glycosyltransferase [Clostridia bacterium]
MKYNPKVTIVIPVYNGEKYIREAIDSAINQTYNNIEIIVINDGSTDNTEKIVKEYSDKVKYIYKPNEGVSTALNLGIQEMTGEYFSWLSHDDLYYPNKIQDNINYIVNNNLENEKIILYSNVNFIDENSKVFSTTSYQYLEPNNKKEYALLRGLVNGISLLIPKKAFYDYSFFSVEFKCIQDYYLFFKMMKTYKFIFIKNITAASRVHKEQVTNTNPKVIEEGNFLWTFMQKEIPDNVKIELEGSIYKFYDEMYKYLLNNSKYELAIEYSNEQREKYLQKGLEMLCRIYKNEKNDFYSVLEKFILNNENNIDTKDYNSIKKISEFIGFEEILKYIISINDNEKFVKLYKKLKHKNKLLRIKYLFNKLILIIKE